MNSEVSRATVAKKCSNCTDSILKDDQYLIFREASGESRDVCIPCSSAATDESGHYCFECDALNSVSEVQTERLKKQNVGFSDGNSH